jgi:hypothetical protein
VFVFELLGFTLHLLRRQLTILLILVECRRSVSESVPSAAVLRRRVCVWCFIETGLAAVGVFCDEAVLDPSRQGAFADSEALRRLCFRQHAAVSQAVVS